MSFILFLVVVAAGKSISLEEFSSKIEGSINIVDSAMLEIGKLDQGKGDLEQYDIEVQKLRQLWPSNILVDDPPNKIAIDSDWVIVELDKLENEENIDRSSQILSEFRSRLISMRSVLDERKQAIAAEPTKDSEKQKLDEILKREEFQKPKVEEGLLARLIRQFFEWLYGQPRDEKPTQTSNAGSPILTTILWIVVIGSAATLILFLIYRLAPQLFKRFGAERASKLKDRVVLGEIIGDDVAAADIFAEAEELARRGELRLAVRKGYIAVLCELADRKLIGLSRHKTNRDYLREIRTRESLRGDLSSLTSKFERHWYGDQQVVNDEWDEFRELYRRTVADQN